MNGWFKTIHETHGLWVCPECAKRRNAEDLKPMNDTDYEICFKSSVPAICSMCAKELKVSEERLEREPLSSSRPFKPGGDKQKTEDEINKLRNWVENLLGEMGTEKSDALRKVTSEINKREEIIHKVIGGVDCSKTELLWALDETEHMILSLRQEVRRLDIALKEKDESKK